MVAVAGTHRHDGQNDRLDSPTAGQAGFRSPSVALCAEPLPELIRTSSGGPPRSRMFSGI